MFVIFIVYLIKQHADGVTLMKYTRLLVFLCKRSAINPLKPNSSEYYTLSYKCQSAQMSEIKNARLGLYGLNIRSVTV